VILSKTRREDQRACQAAMDYCRKNAVFTHLFAP
jgi:hypothetical protein